MSTPATIVEIGLDLSSSTGQFILDSSTDGILGEDKLSGVSFYDITQFVQLCTVTRGRSTQLDYFNAGTAQILLNNKNREFDPLNQDSPYYPKITPRRPIRISTNGKPIFVGYINDWDINYDISGNDTAIVYCSDAFGFLSNMTLSAVTPPAQSSGARIEYVLDRPEVSYTGGRDIAIGTVTAGNYAISDGVNALNYLRQVEKTEQGSLFVSADGDIVFLMRQQFFGDIVSFADDGSGINYSSLTNIFGDELLYNRVVLESPAGTATTSDSASIAEYQISQLSQTNLLNDSTDDLDFLASYLLNKLSTPQLQFKNISVELANKSLEDLTILLNLDIGSYCTLTKSFAVGTPASITQPSIVSGVKHDIRPDSHVVSFSLEYWYQDDVFIVGDSLRGQLDGSYVLR